MIKPGLALFQDSVMIVMSIVQLLGSTGLDPWRLKPWNPYWSYCFWVSNQGVVDDVCCLNAGGHGHHPHHPAPTRIVNLPLLLLVGTLLIFHICIVRRDLTTLEYILAGEPVGAWREPGGNLAGTQGTWGSSYRVTSCDATDLGASKVEEWHGYRAWDGHGARIG